MKNNQSSLARAQINFYSSWLPVVQGNRLFAGLNQRQDWAQHEIKLFGKAVKEPRFSLYFADLGIDYCYAGRLCQAQGWPPYLALIKSKLQALCGCEFNSVLVNYYRHGQDYMGWHSDNEASLGKRPVIASLSLGASRRFLFRCRNSQQRLEYILSHGDLLVMNGIDQGLWQHSLPKSSKIHAARINLSFRQVSPS